MLVSSRMSRGKPSTSSGNQRKALSENDIVPRSAHLHPPPSPPSVLLPISRPIASRVKRSFRIELKTLDVRSNSAHEDEWAANCGLSRMSRGSPPAIFHPRLPLCYKPLSLSLSLSLYSFLSPRSRSNRSLFVHPAHCRSRFLPLSVSLFSIPPAVTTLVPSWFLACISALASARARPHPSCEPLCHSGINSA